MRLNYVGTWDKNTVLPLKYYIDCYGSAYVGGQEYRSERLKRGEVYNYPVGQQLENPKDATCYLYGAKMIQSITGISKVYPSYAAIGPAQKLREISIGSGKTNYYNPFLNTLGMSENTMLEHIDV
jgi:hypothetical protein